MEITVYVAAVCFVVGFFVGVVVYAAANNQL